MIIKQVIEAALFASGQPLSITTLQGLFDEPPSTEVVKSALAEIEQQFGDCGFHLSHSASGYFLQTRQSLATWVGRLWEDRAPRLSRAVWETLAVIAWQQPVTRAGIEDVRGVTVSSNVMRTLQDHDWVVVVGHKDLPGRPALFGTTDTFLREFDLPSLDALPPLVEPSQWQEEDIDEQESLSFAKLLAKHMEKQQQAPDDTSINEALSAADDLNSEFDALMQAPDQTPDQQASEALSEPDEVLLTDDEQNELIAQKLAEQQALLAKSRDDNDDGQ